MVMKLMSSHFIRWTAEGRVSRVHTNIADGVSNIDAVLGHQMNLLEGLHILCVVWLISFSNCK